MTEGHLQELLQSAARATIYPGTPDIERRVMHSIESARLRGPLLRPSFALVALLVAVVIAGAAVLLSPASNAIARLFGVEGSRIERLPPGLPGITPTALPTPAALSSLGRPVTLEEAARLARFQPALPSGGAAPRQVYIVFYAGQAVVATEHQGFDLWQTQLRQNASVGKMLDSRTQVREVSVGGRPGTWLTGGEHFVSYLLPGGQAVLESVRTVDRSTLVWRTPHAFYRIETNLSLAEALRIAEGLP